MSEKLTILVAYIDPTGRVKTWLCPTPTDDYYTILGPVELPASFRATIEAAAIRPPKRVKVDAVEVRQRDGGTATVVGRCGDYVYGVDAIGEYRMWHGDGRFTNGCDRPIDLILPADWDWSTCGLIGGEA